MEIRTATIDDVDLLIKMRLDYLQYDKGRVFTDDEITGLTDQLKAYLPKHIGKDFFAVLAECDNKAVSSVFLAISEKPAALSFITGKTGTIQNVYTYQQYRKRGFASALLSEIIEMSKQMNLSYLELSATKDGKPLYEKFGFKIRQSINYTEMKLTLI